LVNSLLLDISIVIIVATFFAYIVRLLRQPMIPAYILAGVIIGPVLGLITDKTSIAFMSEFGIALMLFIVGLEMNFDRLKNVFKISTMGGAIRSLVFFTFGFIIAMLLGFIRIEALYVGIFFAFSSTAVVVKLLTDKKQLDTLHGRIIVGILLMEDVMAIFLLSILAANTFSFLAVLIALLKVGLLLLLAFLGSKFLFPKIFRFGAKHIELLLLLSISILLFFTALSVYMGELLAHWFHFLPAHIIAMLRPELSIIVGAFIAGLMLGNLPYYIEIIGRVNSLKDFFATMFFVSLGMELIWLKSIIIPLIVLIVAVVIIKLFVTLFICGYFGYRKRPSFLAAFSLTQTSEFSLIIAAQGFLIGHISQEVFSIAVIIAVFTMALSTYFIDYEEKIYNKISSKINWVDSLAGDTSDLEYMTHTKKMVILCGHNRIGYSILKTLKSMKKKMLVVDFNPETIKNLIRKKIPCLYGDVSEVETLDRLDLKNSEMIISTISNTEVNLLIIKKARDLGTKAKLYMTAAEIEDALRLYDAGADYVILPHFLGGEHASALIHDFDKDINQMIKTKMTHIKELKHRHALGHIHPKHNVRHKK
jgi:Kef-type K+ transport system membrane component KefB/Trk K+ transport system NAD-binding subunit